jgi:CRP-like cAMP-binding protein
MGNSHASVTLAGPNERLACPPASPPRAPEASAAAVEVVLRRYSSIASLSDADLALLRSLTALSAPAGKEIEGEGANARAPRLLVSGWAYRFRMLSDGRRMIVGFLLPGDAICQHRQAQAPALVSTAALTPCRLLDAKPLWTAISSHDPRHRRLAEAQHMLDTLDESYLLDHVVRLGRQTAIERICHLLLEFRWRLQAVGLARADEFALPLTQEGLADAVGLSVVHVNRTLQALRRRGLVTFGQGRVGLLDPQSMSKLAEFKPPPSRASDGRMALAAS